MPRAVRAIQSTGQYRTTPFATTSNDRQQQRLRQHQAQQVARQQIQQQQQQQAFFTNTANMQSLSHMNSASQHMNSYGSTNMPSMYMPLPPTTQSYQQSYSNNLQQSSLPPPVPPQNSGLPISTRPSSGAWSPQEDSTLMTARASGQNWSQIQSAYFPTKTANACRKRHERLMDKRNIDDWDALKLEQLGKEYMAMRKEIWGPLAEKCNEKWTVVEAKVLGSGYKNLQSAARASHRRARLSAGGSGSVDSLDAHPSSYTDDSALGDEEYGDSPGTDYDSYDYSNQSQQAQATTSKMHQQQQHQRQHSQGYAQGNMMMGMGVGVAQNGYGGGYAMPMMGRHAHSNSLGGMSNGGRDMGIGSIINGASNGV